MTDWLNPTQTDEAPADGGYLGGDFGATPVADDPYAYDAVDYGSGDAYGDDQGYQAEAHHDAGYGDPYGAPAPMMEAAPAAASNSEFAVQAPYLEDVAPNRSVGGSRGDLSNLVLDVEVPVEVYFGDAQLSVEEFLELGRGSVVELDRPIEAPIELRVRGKLVARGQLVTINGSYGLRITETVEI